MPARRPLLVLRPATRDDVPALVTLINRAYQVEAFFVEGSRIDAEGVAARFERPGAAVLVIDDDRTGGLAGAVFVEIRGERGYFGLLSVDPDRQQEGMGRALVTAAEAQARAAGCRTMDIDVVNLRLELPGFYHALGYTPVGTAPFPEPERLRQPAHMVLMSKPLA